MNNPLSKINWRNVLYVSLWTGSLVGLGFLMSFVNVKSSEYACNALEVTILGEQSFVIREDVDKVLNQTQGPLIGKTLTAIPIHEIEADLSSIPYVDKVIVNKDINGKIFINIIQREAALRIINHFGDDYYLDVNGLKMPLSTHYAPYVLVANGRVLEGYGKSLDSIQTPLLRDVFKLATYVQKDTLWNNQIEQLFVNNEGDIEMVPRVGDHKIIIGDAESLSDKFGKLLVFYKEIIPAVGWSAYRTVDLSFENQLVCEKNEKLIEGN